MAVTIKDVAALLQKMTSAIVDDSFNMISVDGDTSTNDTALVLANGNCITSHKTCSFQFSFPVTKCQRVSYNARLARLQKG